MYERYGFADDQLFDWDDAGTLTGGDPIREYAMYQNKALRTLDVLLPIKHYEYAEDLIDHIGDLKESLRECELGIAHMSSNEIINNLEKITLSGSAIAATLETDINSFHSHLAPIILTLSETFRTYSQAILPILRKLKKMANDYDVKLKPRRMSTRRSRSSVVATDM